MNLLEQSIENVANASIKNSNSIEALTNTVLILANRIEELEERVRKLENPNVCGSGAGHYGGGPWG